MICLLIFFTFRLYKSLEDYDVLRGIFCNLEGTQDITHKALEAEERGNYREALDLYKKVFYRQMLQTIEIVFRP